MTQRSHRVTAFVGLICVLAALTAPTAGSASGGAQTLHVDLTEWAVVPSQGLVSPGPIRLTVTNYGVLRHALAIIPTQSWGEKVGVLNGRAIGERVGPPVVVAPGKHRAAYVYLDRGSYLLVDNVRGHYQLGAAVAILVA